MDGTTPDQRSSYRLPGPTRSGGSVHVTTKRTVTATLAEIYFRYDHTSGSPDAKLLRPSAGDFDDASSTFSKPEWNSSGKNDPVSTTMNNDVVVDLVIDFTVSPAGKTVPLTEIKGVSSEACMNFDRTMTDTVGTERKIIYWLQSSSKTPNSVERLFDSIAWTVTANGNPISLGTTGPHVIYNTLGIPYGKMEKPAGGSLQQTGKTQDVTEERLKFAVACASGKTAEKDCVDGVFNRLKTLGCVYSPGNRWPDTAPTGMSLHHYLWKLANNEVQGECHMLAAAFTLVCEMIGVQGPFDIGYMKPWGRRDGTDPYAPRANPVHGKLNVADTRTHLVKHTWPFSDDPHGDERMIFIDANSKRNNFEGVSIYKSNILYAIGEQILDKFGTADENSDDWYKGANFDLCFFRQTAPDCDNPYPSSVTKTPFKWSD